MATTSSHETYLHPPPFEPRTASSRSLAPPCADGDRHLKRKLLVVYIHGFIGSEDSFHSFPFHVHNQLKEKVAATHVVHSKIYPRYKTYKAFRLARDNLSQWLAAHEEPSTDVILVGHSMGGLLAEEIVLMQNETGCAGKHRIFGTVHMDAPLLGARNRVYLAGLLSPFRSKAGSLAMPAENAPDQESPRECGVTITSVSRGTASTQSLNTKLLLTDEPSRKTNGRLDPHFNKPFANDVRIKDRGWWENGLHFARKHKDEGFIPATFNHLIAHYQFGSCLLDPRRLKERYNALRKLDGAEPGTKEMTSPKFHKRVRFVQFYTASYKGRAGKRYIEKTYTTEVQRKQTMARKLGAPDNDNCERSTKQSHVDAVLQEDINVEELYFCRLAQQANGEVDSRWKKVMVATNDEINAHTVLFVPGPHYDNLVERVSREITGWVAGAYSSSGGEDVPQASD